MPTEIRRPSEAIARLTRTSDAGAPSLVPLATVAMLTLVLHLAMGVVFDRSHAGQTAGPVGVGVPDEGKDCGAEAKITERSLPFD